MFSLMSQYTPMPGLEANPELGRRVDGDELHTLLHYMRSRGLDNGYWQETESATEDMIPAFDLTGLR